MSEALTPTYTPSFLPISAALAVLQAIGTIPELKTTGVVLIQDDRVEQLRAPDSLGLSIVVEIRPRVELQTPAYTPPPTPAPGPRDSGTSAAKEWISLGFNCGGTVLAGSALPVLAR